VAYTDISVDLLSHNYTKYLPHFIYSLIKLSWKFKATFGMLKHLKVKMKMEIA